jgi:hypothetical protein
VPTYFEITYITTYFIGLPKPEALPNPQIGFKPTPSPEESFKTSTSVELKNCEENSVFEKIRVATKLTKEDLLAIICQALEDKGLKQIHLCPNITKTNEMDLVAKDSTQAFAVYRSRPR